MGESTNKLTKERIRVVYGQGAEAVVSLVRELLAEIASLRKRVVELETPANYERFLAHLDPIPEQASKKYDQLFKALVRYLASLGSDDPEKHASETLDDVSRKIGKGETFDDLNSYSRRVARNIHISAFRRRREETNSIDSPAFGGGAKLSSPPEPERSSEERQKGVEQECREHCYDRLPEDDRDLITRYSQASAHDRERMAAESNTTLGALRVRVRRIRQRLERCHEDCVRKNTRSGV